MVAAQRSSGAALVNAARPLLFNPSRAGDDELEWTLVARTELLDELAGALIADAMGPSVRHWLLIGPRGSGKSHLVELLARRTRKRVGWSVVRLPEEAYRVGTYAELLTCLVAHLDGVERPFAGEPDPVRVAERAEARIRTIRAERGPILVIVENLGDLLEGRFGRQGQARLRALLMADPPFVLVATATSSFGAIREHAAPLYDFFQQRRLGDLTLPEVIELVERRACIDDATEILDRPDEVRPRIAALHHLSGGNPRLVLTLYEVLRSGLAEEVHEQLMRTLDEVTPYYQSRLHDASPQGARVLAEMAMAPGPVTPTEIGQRCGMKTNQVTAVLSQLERERFVRPGGRPTDKRARYWEVTDRLFRVWMWMREAGDGDGTVRWIVEFYRGWYGGSSVGLASAAHDAVQRSIEASSPDLSGCVRTVKHLAAAAPPATRHLIGAPLWRLHLRAGMCGAPIDVDTDPASPEAGGAALAAAGVLAGGGRLEQARERLLFAIERRTLEAIEPLARVERALFGSEHAIRTLRRLAVAGWSSPAATHAHLALLAIDGHGDAAVKLATERTRDHETAVGYAGGAIALLMLTGMPDHAHQLLPQAERYAVDVDPVTGPSHSLLRFARGQKLSSAEADSLRVWLAAQPRDALHMVALSMGLGHTHEIATAEAEAAEAERVLPEAQVFLRAFARGLRARLCARRGWPFHRDEPFVLDERSNAEAWGREAAVHPGPFTRAGAPAVLESYRGLRSSGLLAEDIPPWSDAVRVADATDRDAALSALHPEVREAVELILPEG